MKAENNDNKHFFWKCSNCKKEHKIPTLFCNGCGAQRPKKYSFKYNFINTDNPKNIKIIDWIIMIVAFGLSIFCISLFIFNLNYSRSFLVCFFGSFLLLSLIIIIYALRNLFFSKNISFWQRIVVLFVTILFNPVVMFIIFMSVSSCFGPRGCMSKTRRTNKSRFAKACSELVLNKNLYNTKYSNGFSDLPKFIKNTQPVYVWINETNIKVAIILKRPSYGWKFSQNTNGNWALYSYFENELNLLKSDIIINTNNGKVTIPWSFFN